MTSDSSVEILEPLRGDLPDPAAGVEDPQGPSRTRRPHNLTEILLLVIAIALAAIPAGHLLVVGLTTGTNVVSGSDFFATSHIPVIDAVLRGHYDWTHFLSDTMGFGTHQLVVEYLVRIALAKFFFWPVAGEVWIAWAAAVVRTLAIAAVLAHGLQPRIGARRWMILPLLSLLIFGGSQAGLVNTPTIGLNFGLPITGYFVGLWALVCLKNQRTALVVALLSTVFATFSGAYGLVGWPILGVGLMVYGFPRMSRYIWLGVAVLSTIIYSLNVNPAAHAEGAQHGFTPFAIRFWVEAIGKPLVAESPTTSDARYAMSIGIFGALAGIAGVIVLLYHRRRFALRESFPAIAILGFAFGCIWLIGDFRGDPHPWYEIIFMIWWQGVLALAWTICLRSNANSVGVRTRYIAVGVVWILSMLYVNSNIDWRQKSLYTGGRSAAIATCEREWKTSLLSSFNECAGALTPTSTVPASVRTQQLERNHLSVFAPSETRYLQGDWMLPLVSVVASSSPQQRPQWVNNYGQMDVVGYRYSDPELESLTLPAHAQVTWKVYIPSHASEARFRTSVHLSELPDLPVLAGHVSSGHNGRLPSRYSSKMVISASRLDGSRRQQLTIIVSANHDSSINFDLRSLSGGYARLTIEAGATTSGTTAVMARPIVKTNTDVKHIHVTEDHLPFEPPSPDDQNVSIDPKNWIPHHTTSTVTDDSTLWTLESPDAAIESAPNMHVCLADVQGLLIDFQYRNVQHDVTDLGMQVGFQDERTNWTYLRIPARATNDRQTLYVPLRAAGPETPIFLEKIFLGLRGPTEAISGGNEMTYFNENPFSGAEIHSITLSKPFGVGHCPGGGASWVAPDVSSQ